VFVRLALRAQSGRACWFTMSEGRARQRGSRVEWRV
jgi:hypothetical protein